AGQNGIVLTQELLLIGKNLMPTKPAEKLRLTFHHSRLRKPVVVDVPAGTVFVPGTEEAVGTMAVNRHLPEEVRLRFDHVNDLRWPPGVYTVAAGIVKGVKPNEHYYTTPALPFALLPQIVLAENGTKNPELEFRLTPDRKKTTAIRLEQRV